MPLPSLGSDRHRVGLIATDKGWNCTCSQFAIRNVADLYFLVFLAGNGGAVPKHAQLFATDVPPSKVIRIIDRYILVTNSH